MRLSLCLFFLLTFTLPALAHAEIKTISHTVQQPFGGSQSPDDARTAGIARAKREALERFGTYIESSTVVKNSQVDSDEILALTAGVTKAEVVKQKNYTDGEGFGLEITVKVELDTVVLDQSLKRLLQDRNHLKDLKDARQREKQLLARIAELEKQNSQQGKSEKQKETLKKEFQKTRDGLTAVEWFDKAMVLWSGSEFTNPLLARDYLSNAIKSEPDNANSYNNRGVLFNQINKSESAIIDFNKAINLGNNKAYTNRGIAYSKVGKFKIALSDFNKALSLNKSYEAYYNRGLVFFEMKKYQASIEDFNKAIEISPNIPDVYYNRGSAYRHLNKYHLAIEDYSNVIKFQPKNPDAYVYRGISYYYLDAKIPACRDFIAACQMGECSAYIQAKQKKFCR